MSSETVINPDRFFSCTRCGQCCKGYGGTYVSDQDIVAIGRYLGMAATLVKSKFCARSGLRYVLAQRADGFCTFWDGDCTIHPVKPRMCRQWPFIAGLKADIGNWQVMAGMCPGIRCEINPRQLRAYIDSLESPDKIPSSLC